MIALELTYAERKLILKYGFPFAQIERALSAVANSRRIEIVEFDEGELDNLIGDLCRSINDGLGGNRVQDDLNNLCERLEYAQRTGDGMLDV